MSSTETSDLALMSALRAGDDAALNVLIERWQQPLFAFAWRYLRQHDDAQEVVAETFVRLYRAREKLDGDTRLKGWLFTTLANLCHNHHRWRQRHPGVSLEEPVSETRRLGDGIASDEPGPRRLLAERERRELLRDALDRLSHEGRTALVLYHFEGLSYREIGEVLQCSERGVETRIYRAKQQLRALLAGSWADAPRAES